MNEDPTDVVVVGAGLAGLAAARAAMAAGRSVVVLEGRDRVGGRTLSESIGDGPDDAVDLGAQWITSRQARIHELARGYRIPVFDCYHDGSDVTIAEGVVETSAPAVAPGEARDAVVKLDALAATVPVDAPWNAEHAVDWDRVSLGGWLEQEVRDADARAWVVGPAEGYFAVRASEVPLLHALFYARANGGFAYLVGDAGIPSNQRSLAGGSQRLAIAIGDDLDARVRLGCAVRCIRWDEDLVHVGCDTREVRARRAIVAMAPTLAARIDYEPALPARRDHLCQRFPLGTGWKFQVTYDEPFWRADGYSGRVTDLDRALDAYDGSPMGGRLGAVIVFMGIEAGWRVTDATPLERRSMVLESLELAFGPTAAKPKLFLERMWGSDPFSRGDVGVPTLGTWTMYGQALRDPVGPIHWAGAETATEFPGQMEGAIRSGERAAREVLDALDARDGT